MNRLFWGLIFILLDYRLELGSAVIGLIPDFVGYYLIMKGMEQLSGESKIFDRGRHVAFGMILLSVILYGMDLLNLSSMARVAAWALGLVGLVAQLYLVSRMVAGIRQMEQDHARDLQSGKLRSLWLILAVIHPVCYLLNWVPLVGTVCGLAAAVVSVCFLAAMFDTIKRMKA